MWSPNPLKSAAALVARPRTYLAPVAAILSKKSNHRPVKMVMDRPAVFMASGPAPGGKVSVKMGVTNDGKIHAFDGKLWYEAGAYPGSAFTAGINCFRAAYDVPNSRIDAHDVVVNKPKSAAYRAPGSPQVCFAIETVVDEICETMGWDKMQFRLDNASTEGSRNGNGVMFNRIGLVEMLEQATGF